MKYDKVHILHDKLKTLFLSLFHFLIPLRFW